MLLNNDAKKKGVITASAGNHALALAWHGKDLGVPVICVMPTTAPLAKVDKCRKFGANVILHGEHIGEAKQYAQKEYPDLKYINGYDDPVRNCYSISTFACCDLQSKISHCVYFFLVFSIWFVGDHSWCWHYGN
jgi:threonine synthase